MFKNYFNTLILRRLCESLLAYDYMCESFLLFIIIRVNLFYSRESVFIQDYSL